MITSKVESIHKFLTNNDYELVNEEGVTYYHKSGYSDIEVNDSEVVFISDIGDYAHFPINNNIVYTLIGFMLVGRQLDCAFKY